MDRVQTNKGERLPLGPEVTGPKSRFDSATGMAEIEVSPSRRRKDAFGPKQKIEGVRLDQLRDVGARTVGELREILGLEADFSGDDHNKMVELLSLYHLMTGERHPDYDLTEDNETGYVTDHRTEALDLPLLLEDVESVAGLCEVVTQHERKQMSRVEISSRKMVDDVGNGHKPSNGEVLVYSKRQRLAMETFLNAWVDKDVDKLTVLVKYKPNRVGDGVHMDSITIACDKYGTMIVSAGIWKEVLGLGKKGEHRVSLAQSRIVDFLRNVRIDGEKRPDVVAVSMVDYEDEPSRRR